MRTFMKYANWALGPNKPSLTLEGFRQIIVDLANPESEGKVGDDVKLPGHLERRVREYFALSDAINFKDFETIVRSEDIIMFLYFDSSRTQGISKADIVDTLKAFPLNEKSPLLECYFGSVSFARCQRRDVTGW